MLGVILLVTFLDKNRTVKLIISLLFTFFFLLNWDLTINLKKCPECYNTDFCLHFKNQQIRLTWFSRFMLILNPNLRKSVFHGIFNGSQIVVLKKKAERTDKSRVYSDLGVTSVLSDVELNAETTQNVILCPGFQNVDFLFDQIKDIVEGKKLWYDITTSIEPLLLMFFQPQNKWPVPKYLGACGDIVVEEYKGEPLTKFITSDFTTRAFLALQLLKIAHLFTFEHPEFIFYFTDFSLDNLVVDSAGSISLVDLDHIIIFNKTAQKGNYFIKGSIHTSEVFDEDYYSFSSAEICSHYLSDHNYFSVCKYLLAHQKEGLFNEIPQNIKYRYNLLHLLNECIKPKQIDTRFSAGKKLQVFLKETVKNYKWQL